MADFVLQDEIFYHGTRAQFVQFRPLSHFGSLDAANEIIAEKDFIKSEKLDGLEDIKSQTHLHAIPTQEEYVIPVKLNLTNTYEVQDIAACHDLATYKSFVAYHIAHDLKLDFIPHFFTYIFDEPLNMKYHDIKQELHSDNLYTPTSEHTDRYHLTFQRMIQYFESIGYDGFHYINQYEDPGHTSYIVFRPNNIIRQDTKQNLTPIKLSTKQKIPEFFPAYDITKEHKNILRLEELHHCQLLHQKHHRHQSQTNPEHADKIKAHYTKIFYADILPKIKKSQKGLNLDTAHTEQTVLYGLDIAIVCAYDPMPVMLACAMHDIYRTNNNSANCRTQNAVPFVKKFISDNFPKMNRGTIEEIINAVKKHSFNEKADNLTSACSWDASRIRYAWDNNIYCPEIFSTEYGKYLADLPPAARAAYIKKQEDLLIKHNIKSR